MSEATSIAEDGFVFVGLRSGTSLIKAATFQSKKKLRCNCLWVRINLVCYYVLTITSDLFLQIWH